MRTVYFLLTMILATSAYCTETAPNVLLISIDDLNDWVGVLGGHPQAKTPNIDALAARGTLFTNAHCQAPVCNPSRASLMTSRMPSTTGIYFLNPELSATSLGNEQITMPERFVREGYAVLAAGKLFHNRDNAKYFENYVGNFGGFGPTPETKISQPHGHPLWDWGAYPEKTTDMPDDKIADWAANALQEKYDKPFFLGVGFFRPHVPMFAPQEWFDKHPLDKVTLPATMPNDRNDIPQYGRDLTTLDHVAPTHEWMTESGEWNHAVQSYLASVTFADACVGKVLDALERSPHRDNTIIVLFSDHGFHLGEKERWAKRSLWEDGTRVPLIIADAPNRNPVANRPTAPVGLIDIFPTLLSLCGLPSDSNHEGHDITPLMKNPEMKWKYPAITTFGPGNHAIRTQSWRYIRYNDGSEELYDHTADPNEWNNMANLDEYRPIRERLKAFIPTQHQVILGENSTGHKAFAAAETQRAENQH